MNANEFCTLMCAVTGRTFTMKRRLAPFSTYDFTPEQDIPLEGKVSIYRPKGDNLIWMFDWSTPKNEDNLARSFVTAFCNKWREPDPKKYGEEWQKYAQQWETNKYDSPCWNHHYTYMLSSQDLKQSVMQTAATLGARTWVNGFYPTNYGVGIFIIYAGSAIKTTILEMDKFLKQNNVPFKNELSEKGWVLRFKIERSKADHIGLLNQFKSRPLHIEPEKQNKQLTPQNREETLELFTM